MTTAYLLLGLVLLAVGGVLLWWWSLSAVTRARGMPDGSQEVEITIDGAYTPDTIVVQEGRLLRLIFNRQETNPCSEQVIFSIFHPAVRLAPFRRTAVQFVPDQAGECLFTCEMGIYHGRLIVEARRRGRLRQKSQAFLRRLSGLSQQQPVK